MTSSANVAGRERGTPRATGANTRLALPDTGPPAAAAPAEQPSSSAVSPQGPRATASRMHRSLGRLRAHSRPAPTMHKHTAWAACCWAIASRLFVTERTVEAHVTQIFLKLRSEER